MIVISPGHFGKGTGAVGYIDEVEEATKVVKEVAAMLKEKGVRVFTVFDQVSKNQKQNLHYLKTEHAKFKREMDVFVHFNATARKQAQPIGTEVLYKSEQSKLLAQKLSHAMSEAGKFVNRGAKYRDDLYVLNTSPVKAVILEICFVNSKQDVTNYHKYFHEICKAIAQTLVSEFSDKTLKQTERAFSSNTLSQQFQALVNNKQFIEQLLQLAVREQVVQPTWLQKMKLQQLTEMDICAIALMYVRKQYIETFSR